jgi:hypothetical protein
MALRNQITAFGFLLASATSLLAPVPASAAPSCQASMPKDTICTCRLADLHPTQLAVGFLHVSELKQEGFDHLAKHVAKEEKNRAKIVAGPGGVFYIVDGHHHARAMSDLQPAGTSTCEIVGNMQSLPAQPALFWDKMVALSLARLEGPDGIKRDGVFPPANLHALPNDPFRSVSSWLEDRCDIKLSGDFAEFKLADLLRHDPNAVTPHSEADKDAALREALVFVNNPANLPKLTEIANGPALNACK